MGSSLYSVNRNTEYTAVKTQTAVTTVLFIEVNHRMKLRGSGEGGKGGEGRKRRECQINLVEHSSISKTCFN